MLYAPCKEYGLFIQENRLKTGLSIEQLAEFTSTTVWFIKQTEEGKVYPTESYMDQLARILNIPYHELKTKIWCNPPQQLCPQE
ncbi:MAG TPA: helix-turn-helix transcriptional regulator [Bacillus sp. (in: firmicutes)]|nr:helix-turn-helix transcriptional regulator [Bacillus sp. (in: firmicutes)]